MLFNAVFVDFRTTSTLYYINNISMEGKYWMQAITKSKFLWNFKGKRRKKAKNRSDGPVVRLGTWLIPRCIPCKVLPSSGPNCSSPFTSGVAMGLKAGWNLIGSYFVFFQLAQNTCPKSLLSWWAWVSSLRTDTPSAVQKKGESRLSNNFSLIFSQNKLFKVNALKVCL